MRTPRQIVVADHLWDALERMAEEMGSDRDALVNQALHALARANGYVVPGAGPRVFEPPPGRGAVTARVLETAERLERAMEEPPTLPAPRVLLIQGDDGAEARVEGDRFLVGRGRHCDLVVDSAKVSREHAAIVRDGVGFWIEDLGSSNGTWFQRERIARRRIGDGDEYFVAGERLRCHLR